MREIMRRIKYRTRHGAFIQLFFIKYGKSCMSNSLSHMQYVGLHKEINGFGTFQSTVFNRSS